MKGTFNDKSSFLEKYEGVVALMFKLNKIPESGNHHGYAVTQINTILSVDKQFEHNCHVTGDDHYIHHGE